MCLEISLEQELKNLKSDFCLLLVLQVLTYQELFLQKEEGNSLHLLQNILQKYSERLISEPSIKKQDSTLKEICDII